MKYIERDRAPTEIPLSARQLEVAHLLADGWSEEEIASHLGVSVHTVAYHIYEGARRIPGDMPRASRLVAWYRGADTDVLEPAPGAGLRKALARKSH